MKRKGKPAKSLADRFWPRVDLSSGDNGCWKWTGPLLKGHGMVWVNELNTTIGCPRASFYLTFGFWPNHTFQTCSNKWCLNPKHLQDLNDSEMAIKRIEKNGFHLKPGPKQTEESFRSKINILETEPDKCWEWNQRTDTRGYGIIRYHNKTFKAHRLAYKLWVGDLRENENMFVCHRCDNPPCCNPNHLFLGTVQDNVTDMVSKGRNTKGTDTCPYENRLRGESNPYSKLNAEKVIKIREMCKKGMPYKEIAPLFGISPHTISKIHLRLAWKHVP